MGIDIGSGSSKAVLTQDGKLAANHILNSGTNYQKTARRLVDELLAKVGIALKDVSAALATGYGAESVPFEMERVADIRCCARGINVLFPAARTVIDIEGMSSQVLRVNEKGQVTNFVVSEKCAAGSGRFLDVIANVLRIRLEDIGELSLKAKNPVTFTTGCAVFGESEAISRVSEGAAKEDILAGVHRALANKIYTLIERVGMEKECAVCGGGALNTGLIKAIEERLAITLLVPAEPQFVTALGAARLAEESSRQPGKIGSP